MMPYILGAAGIVSVVSWLATWFLWGQLEDEKDKRIQAETAVAVQKVAIETMADQMATAKAELSVLAAENKEVDLLNQRREAEINALRLTLAQQAYEAPYRNSVDIHNWLARWMRDIEAAGGGRPAGAVDSTADPTSSSAVPAEAD